MQCHGLKLVMGRHPARSRYDNFDTELKALDADRLPARYPMHDNYHRSDCIRMSDDWDL